MGLGADYSYQWYFSRYRLLDRQLLLEIGHSDTQTILSIASM
jgi:hypothetical protein